MLSPLASAQTRSVADAMAAGQFGPCALKRRADEVRQHYDRVSATRGDYITKNPYYYEQVYRLLRFIVPPGKRVLQVGLLTPDFLDAVQPSLGVGIDFSSGQVEEARRRFPHLHFRLHENYAVGGDEVFDYVLVTDINDQVDPIATLRALRPAMHDDTRLIIDNYNHLWEPIIRFAERFGVKYSRPLQNWLSTDDLANIMGLCDYQPMQVHHTVLLPKRIPLLSA